MKTFKVTIPAQVTIADPEYYNGHSCSVVATIRTIDGSTNIKHETLICALDEDPTERFLKAFGAIPMPEQPAPDAMCPQCGTIHVPIFSENPPKTDAPTAPVPDAPTTIPDVVAALMPDAPLTDAPTTDAKVPDELSGEVLLDAALPDLKKKKS